MFIFILCFFTVSGEESKWVLAAERFSNKNIPPVYEKFSEMIPTLLVSRLSGVKSRVVLADESLGRQLRILSDQRISLVNERSTLIVSRDRILLTSDPELLKLRKKSDVTESILVIEKKINDLDKTRKKILTENTGVKDQVTDISLWKSGTALYTRSAGKSLSSSLSNDKISALLTGSVEDIAGYLYVSAQIETGIPDFPVVSVAEACSYDDIESLISSLSVRLLPEIAKRSTVQLKISVSPENARIFIDGQLISDTSVPVTVFSGEHTIDVSARGFKTATKIGQFQGSDVFALTISLQPEELISVSFDTRKMPASLFLHTQYIGETPQTITIPAISTIGQVISGDVSTYFIFRPHNSAEPDPVRMIVKVNKTETVSKIEKQRRLFYWALGALYISLPPSMFTYGISLNKYQSFQDGHLPQTDAVVNDINNWSNASLVTRGISLALGVNVCIQLVRYLIAAEQATPQNAEEDSK